MDGYYCTIKEEILLCYFKNNNPSENDPTNCSTLCHPPLNPFHPLIVLITFFYSSKMARNGRGLGCFCSFPVPLPVLVAHRSVPF